MGAEESEAPVLVLEAVECERRAKICLGAVDFSSIEKVFFQHRELFQHPKGVFSAPGVFSASTVFYQHLRCFSSTQKIVFL